MKNLKQTLALSIIMLSITIANAQWSQLGADIDGEENYSNYGNSVSLSSDGATIAIGAFFNSGNGTDAGHVRVLHYSAGTWTQIGSDIDGETMGDYSGISVDLNLDGSILAIGASMNGGTASNAGHVRIFKNISGIWTQIGSDINGEAGGDQSGISVSISSDGSIVAIGARYNNGSGSDDAGHVRIFEDISGTWTQVGSDINGEADNDYSGSSISLNSNGSIVAIGAPSNDEAGSNAGHVRVYENISGSWTQIGSDIDGETAGDESGCSVSLNATGSIIAIGAKENDGNGTNAGHVRIFENISGSWNQIGNDINGELVHDYSGCSVDLNSDGSIVAIGAKENDGAGTNASGHVRIYENISGTWTQIGSDIDGEAIGDNSGYSTCLNSDGRIVAIGAVYNDGTGNSTGHARVYSLCGTDSNITIVSCNSYTSPSGNYTWTNTGTYYDTIPNNAGCDSLITIDLTINSVNTSLTQIGITLTANTSGANYQWLDCGNSYAIIPGETNQSFTPIINGNYAAEITENGCTDTSACYNIISVEIIENISNINVSIYPNPSTGKFTIKGLEIQKIEIFDITGKLIYKTFVNEIEQVIDVSYCPKGIYFVKVITLNEVANTRLIIK